VLIYRVGDDFVYLWAPAGGTVVALVDAALEGDLLDAMALPGGKLAVLSKFVPDQGHERREPQFEFQRLLVFDRRGRRVAHRTFALDDEHDDALLAGIAIVDGMLGVHRLENWSPRRPAFYPIVPTAPTRELVPPNFATMPICSQRSRSRATPDVSILMSDAEISSRDDIPAPWRIYVRNASPRCIEGVELSRDPDEAEQVALAAMPSGELRGEHYQGNVYRSTRQHVRCVPAK
jgi:hypothetical protein